MKAAKTIFVLIAGVSLGSLALAESLQVTGTARENTGNPLYRVRVTVKDNQGKIVAETITNRSGRFAGTAVRGKMKIECKSDMDIYSQNPVVVGVELLPGANSVDQPCTFDEATVSAEHWERVAEFVDLKATQTKNDKLFNTEWKRIDSGNLPPDSKAAAAREFKAKGWSDKISDPKFFDYTTVDVGKVSSAIKGNVAALSNLPGAVAKDVQSYKSLKAE